jgi:hypothetical protein
LSSQKQKEEVLVSCFQRVAREIKRMPAEGSLSSAKKGKRAVGVYEWAVMNSYQRLDVSTAKR